MASPATPKAKVKAKGRAKAKVWVMATSTAMADTACGTQPGAHTLVQKARMLIKVEQHLQKVQQSCKHQKPATKLRLT